MPLPQNGVKLAINEKIASAKCLDIHCGQCESLGFRERPLLNSGLLESGIVGYGITIDSPLYGYRRDRRRTERSYLKLIIINHLRGGVV